MKITVSKSWRGKPAVWPVGFWSLIFFKLGESNSVNLFYLANLSSGLNFGWIVRKVLSGPSYTKILNNTVSQIFFYLPI